METLKCCRCGVERSLDCFVRDKKRIWHKSRGYSPSCKVCRAEYYQRNREQILAQRRAFCAANAERLRAEKKEYIERRFFYKRAANMMNRIEGARTGLPQKTAEISRLWKQQRGICPVTGRRLNRDNAQIDHILPITRGGTHDIGNLRWVHKDVNYAKRDLVDAEFFKLCLDIASNLKKQAKRLNGDSKGESPCLTLF